MNPAATIHERGFRRTRTPAWLPVLVAPVVPALLANQPRWAVMWTTAAVLWFGCKWAMSAEALFEMTGGKRAAYWLLWPGMDPAPFTPRATLPKGFKTRGLAPGVVCMVAGALLIVGAASLVRDARVVGWMAWIGLVLFLHFGLFHLLAVGFRMAGIDVRPLMKNPLAARSVADFWGNRWNHAFQEAAHRLLFKPIAPAAGTIAATVTVFLVSGIAHELVVTVPAQAGYGGPTAYFLLQAFGLLFERSRAGRAIRLNRPLLGRLWTYLVVLAPITLLFPAAFLSEVIAPFVRTLLPF